MNNCIICFKPQYFRGSVFQHSQGDKKESTSGKRNTTAYQRRTQPTGSIEAQTQAKQLPHREINLVLPCERAAPTIDDNQLIATGRFVWKDESEVASFEIIPSNEKTLTT